MRNHDYFCASRLVFFFQKASTEGRIYSQKWKKSGRNQITAEPLRVVTASEAERAPSPGHHGLEDLVPLPEISEIER
jgi:hypothetical protein